MKELNMEVFTKELTKVCTGFLFTRVQDGDEDYKEFLCTQLNCTTEELMEGFNTLNCKRL